MKRRLLQEFYCPICRASFQNFHDHITNYHSDEEIELAIIKDKEQGLTDKDVGKKYRINLKRLEQIIRKHMGVNISVGATQKVIKTFEPANFQLQKTTIWSFKSRGNWATHSGAYRGNWSPFIPRNVILMFSREGDLVLDQFCGGGTTAVEAKLLGRRCIAVDINEKAIELAKQNVNFNLPLSLYGSKIYEPELIVGDARNLYFIPDNSVDLICAHPPYSDAIKYTENTMGDLSHLKVDDFLAEMRAVASESFRVLKPGKFCAILIGDLRRGGHIVPLGFKLMNVFMEAGFLLKYLVIKLQHNCKATGFWLEKSRTYNFLLLAHEYLPIFYKPQSKSTFVSEQRVANFQIKFAIPALSSENIEGTTVWFYDPSNFEEFIETNVAFRYGNGTPIIRVFSPYTSGNLNERNFEHELNTYIANNERFFESRDYVTFHAYDFEFSGYIFPTAKYIVDFLNLPGFALKEIIILIPKNYTDIPHLPDNELLRVHSYLLVYRRT
ncbi:MAG: DNA methyltransferase [candidate division WOR-3 bacterium]